MSVNNISRSNKCLIAERMIKEKERVYDLCVSRFPAYVILPKQYTTVTIIMPAFITKRGRKAVTIISSCVQDYGVGVVSGTTLASC